MNDQTIATPVRALHEQFERAQAAARSEPAVPWPVRADRLRRLEVMIRDERARMADAISADFGNRSRHETDLLEMFPALEGIKHALSHGKSWMRAQRRRTGFWFLPASSRLLPQPLGLIGVVTPWNYPLYLTVGPLTSAFVAGNRAMVKLSEYTPRFGTLFETLVQSYFGADELHVTNGDASVAEAFCTLPFDHLLFTGSTAVGHHVMQAASANLTPVTLELGGKSPVLIGPGANFQRAVDRVMAGKLVNAGQTCIAPDYVLLPRGSEKAFIDAARALVAKGYPGLNQPGAASPDYTTIIAPRHFERLERQLDEVRQGGAEVTALSSAPIDAARRLMPPYVITGAKPSDALMREEIFGPILPLVSYDSWDEALAYINARPRPLALYIFERDGARVDAALERTVAGGVSVNETLLHIAQDDLPFGGVGPSGMGAYHGHAGFLTFSHMKPVFRQSPLNGMGLFKPPYGRVFERMVGLLMR
jgi:acyl-CoA reductase-like NAD-dependent aldehyde dehydrogenase